MKNYKKVQIFAKNSPKGSYAAGCPVNGTPDINAFCWTGPNDCRRCERTA